MSGKIHKVSWKTFASSKGLSYKETKWIRAGRESEETIVLMMIVQYNVIVGKGLYWVISYKEKT